MFVSAQQLESVLLKRLEQEKAGPSGLAHALRSVLQAHNSAIAVEWSSTDGTDGTEDQDQVQMDVNDSALSLNLEAWWTWLSRGAGDLQQSRYCAAAHALIQRSALDTAWQADAGGSEAIPKKQFVASLAALAHAVCQDGTARAASACLASLLKAARDMAGWDVLLEMYGGGEAAAAPGPRAVAESMEQSESKAAAGGIAEGLFSRAGSNLSTVSAPAGQAAPTATAVISRVAQKASAESLGGPELATELSETSSNGLGEVPDDLNADGQHAHGSRRPAQGVLSSEEGKGNLTDMPLDLRSWANLKDGKPGRAAGKPAGGRPGGGPLIPIAARGVGGGAGVLGKVGGGDVGSSAVFGSKPALDQHLKGARAGDNVASQPPLLPSRLDGAKANPLHNSIIMGARQSVERQTSVFGRQAAIAPPVRERAINTSRNTSRNISHKQSIKFLSVSEPAPTGPQAEWKNLPSLGHQAPRSHPHELRKQPSQGPVRGPQLHPEKLPSLPMSGARGQPPKAMETARRPSHNGRAVSDSHCAPSAAHLPGLGVGLGNAKPAQDLRTMRLPSKQSFRGDRDF
ncbi:hypothetical protein TSOC_005148 [Tetrabaena socialis]|uniref:Uncharacterized protein n=1 Tax=Tetrabaena socialis TaxID=47790 RepID=A0A2J8A711_9CHLO|nr:hypothetical protein TSOC_005148 [Tetrabaena socialis]|eukprot:PNH08311.1 hypothetical protein TSOC_005148 [Tetrabaena socialis]